MVLRWSFTLKHLIQIAQCPSSVFCSLFSPSQHQHQTNVSIYVSSSDSIGFLLLQLCLLEPPNFVPKVSQLSLNNLDQILTGRLSHGANVLRVRFVLHVPSVIVREIGPVSRSCHSNGHFYFFLLFLSNRHLFFSCGILILFLCWKYLRYEP